ncbi:helix-turn-helix transcriptional regulator [Rhizobium sp. Root1220]|uniref:helix-turn-helix transcriptional regulator n=1 Tax=Rhizobium sp. Root1220 TaxID=1736432 RepID=UPI001FCD862D|nr:helix-turn-helix transcriptional regulator [Rhizobium sp. Root1220]
MGAPNVDISRSIAVSPAMRIFASQLRASRALLAREQEVIAGWVGLDRREVGGWEAGKYKLMSKVAINLRRAYERAGIDFIDACDGLGAGVRLRTPATDDPHRSAQYRAARALADLSQADVAKVARVNRNFVARLELGEVVGVNLTTLAKLDEAFSKLDIILLAETSKSGLGVRWRTEASGPPNKEDIRSG